MLVESVVKNSRLFLVGCLGVAPAGRGIGDVLNVVFFVLG